MPPSDLILRNDYLDTVGLLCAWNRVFEDANCADNLAVLYDAELPALAAGAEVTWVTNYLFGLDSFGSAAYTDKFAITIGDNLIDRFVEHVSAAIDGGETCKRLG